MQTKALYILHIYIDSDYKKDDFFTPTPVLYAVQVLICSFATSTHVCNVFSLGGFVKKSRCPGLTVVSYPRNVLRDKQGRLLM